MKKKFVIYDIRSQEFFQSADWSNAYFGKDDSKKFDSKEEAENRLKEEFELFKAEFIEKEIIIQEVFVFE